LGHFVDFFVEKRRIGEIRLGHPQTFSMIGERNDRQVLPHGLEGRYSRSKYLEIARLRLNPIELSHQLEEVRRIQVDGQAQTEPRNDRCATPEILFNRDNISH
jgi:hypothetical protein